MNITIDDVVLTEDGGKPCYDVALQAREIHRLLKFGFLQIDDERQRGRDTVSDKPVIKQDKIERWTEQLIEGTAYLGQLTWNVRPENGDPGIKYDPDSKRLTLSAMQAFLPDSAHRHKAIEGALESVARGSEFNVNRKVSVRIYNIDADEEPTVFYAYNQEGEAADEGRSKWLKPQDHARLAREFVVRCESLGEKNVDTVRDRLSKKSYRLASFGTISRAIEDGWNWNADELQNPVHFDTALTYLIDFWNRLVTVLPELGFHSLSERKAIRENLLVDNALAINAYMKIAYWLYDNQLPLDTLDALTKKMVYRKNGVETEYDLFDRQNPVWQDVGLMVQQPTKKGQKLNLRNARQTREAMYVVLRGQLEGKTFEAPAIAA